MKQAGVYKDDILPNLSEFGVVRPSSSGESRLLCVATR